MTDGSSSPPAKSGVRVSDTGLAPAAVSCARRQQTSLALLLASGLVSTFGWARQLSSDGVDG